MKARVKATGEIVEVKFKHGYVDHNYETPEGGKYSGEELDFSCEPDYWDKLYHQTAIAAMQGILSSDVYMEVLRKNTISKVSISEDVVRCACDYADTLLKNFKNKK